MGRWVDGWMARWPGEGIAGAEAVADAGAVAAVAAAVAVPVRSCGRSSQDLMMQAAPTVSVIIV